MLLSPRFVFADCDNVESLFKIKEHGERSIQQSSNMCYAFSVSHALRTLTDRFINPIDIAYQFQRYKNPARKVQYYDMAIGADIEFYDDSFIESLMVWGLCTKDLSSTQKRLLSTVDIKEEAKKQDKTYLSYFNELIEGIANDCHKDRFYSRGIRPLFMPIKDSYGRKVMTSDNGINAINLLLKKKTPVVLNSSLKIVGKTMGNHSMLIIGSRKEGHSCSYEVLDSLPKSFCESISEDDVAGKNCNEGRYWIKEARLREHMISLIGFRVRK